MRDQPVRPADSCSSTVPPVPATWMRCWRKVRSWRSVTRRTKATSSSLPSAKVRRGGTRGGTNYKWTREGWALAWAEFEAGDPAAAAEYRLLEDRRQEAIARDALRRAKAEAPVIAMRALRDASFAVVPKCGWINGYGFGGLSEHEVTIFFLLDSIEIVPTTSNQPILSLQLTDLLMVQVDGPGLVTTGSGFIGGGEGLTGAIEGMAIARVLNALTTST